MEEAITKTIAALLKSEWVNVDPTPECFDFLPEKMRQLLEFVEGRMLQPERPPVCEHLRKCRRCRYLFSAMREEDEAKWGRRMADKANEFLNARRL